MCKERIRKSVRVKLQEQCDATKLRLVRNTKWEIKEYIRKGTASLIQQVIKIRLNMTNKKTIGTNMGKIFSAPFVKGKRTQLNTY